MSRKPEEYDDETVTEVKVGLDAPHVADLEPPTLEAQTSVISATASTAREKDIPTREPKVIVALDSPADAEPPTLDPPKSTVASPILPLGADGEPDTLKPPQTLGVRQIAAPPSKAPPTPQPGIGREEMESMSAILEESTSTEAVKGPWLEAARKMLVTDPDGETASTREPPVVPAAPPLELDDKTERRPRKKVTMIGIPLPANAPPEAGASASVASKPQREIDRTDRMIEAPTLEPVEEPDDKTEIDLAARPPAPPPIPPTAPRVPREVEKNEPPKPEAKRERKTTAPIPREEPAFETRRDPSLALPQPSFDSEPDATARDLKSPLEKPSTTPIEVKPVTLPKAAPRPATMPLAERPAPVPAKTMASAAVPPLAPLAEPEPPPSPLPEVEALRPITEAAPAPPTLPIHELGMLEERRAMRSPQGLSGGEGPRALEERSALEVPAPPSHRTPTPPFVMPSRTSPGLIAGAIAAGVLLLVSGIGVGYTLRAPSLATPSATATTPTAPAERMPGDPSPAASVAVTTADPEDIPPVTTAKAKGKPKTKPAPTPTTSPPKPKPKPTPLGAPAPTTPPTPTAAPKNFDPNGI